MNMARKKKPEAPPPPAVEAPAAVESESGEAARPLYTPEHLAETNRIALGLPDAAGRRPGQREQLGALQLLASFSVTKPTTDRAEDRTLILVDPYWKCPRCGAAAEDGPAPKPNRKETPGPRAPPARAWPS
jgi:hypothetical protein